MPQQMFRPVQLVVLAAKGKTGFWFLDKGSYTNGRAVKMPCGHSSVLNHICANFENCVEGSFGSTG